jgi:hypothetical protein
MHRSQIVAALALAVLSSAPAEARHRGVPWCGLYMMKVEHKSDPRLAQARAWAREGMNAGGPSEGAIVVWPHHVGKIVGRTNDGRWIVNSGNDGGRVRTRVRSLFGAIAFRRL